jgi:hypothetical protein
MIDTARQWQTVVKIGRRNPAFDPQSARSREASIEYEPEWIMEDDKTFYGDTLSSLLQAVREWLTENKPTYFATEAAICYYSDGTQTTGGYLKSLREEGWYSNPRGSMRSLGVESPRSFESALGAFLANGTYAEKGPDHQDTPIIDGKLQLHLIKTVRREREEYKVNQYVKRGWYIVSIDHVAESDSQSVYSVYVLGHPEADAS